MNAEAQTVMLRNHPLIHVSCLTDVRSGIRDTLPPLLHTLFDGAQNATRAFKHYKAHLTITKFSDRRRRRDDSTEQFDLVISNWLLWRNMLMLLGSKVSTRSEHEGIRDHAVSLKLGHFHTLGLAFCATEQKRILQDVTDMWWSFPHFSMSGGHDQAASTQVLRSVKRARWRSFESMAHGASQGREKAHSLLLAGRVSKAIEMFQETSIIVSYDVHEMMKQALADPTEEAIGVGLWSFENTLLCTLGTLECEMAQCRVWHPRSRDLLHAILASTDLALQSQEQLATVSDERFARILQCRAYALRMLGDFKEAGRCLKEAHRLQPDNTAIRSEFEEVNQLLESRVEED